MVNVGLFFILTVSSLIILSFVGWGFLLVLIPPRLRKYDLLLSPLVGTAIITILVNLNYLGLATKYIYVLILLVSLSLIIVSIFKGIKPKITTFSDFKPLFIILLIVFLFACLPFLDKGLTTATNGNNDAYLYVSIAEHLQNKTINNVKSYTPLNPDSVSISRVAKLKWSVGTDFLLGFLSKTLNLRAFQIYPVFGITLVLLIAISGFLLATACLGFDKTTGYLSSALLGINSYLLFFYFQGALNNLLMISAITVAIGFSYLALTNKDLKFYISASLFIIVIANYNLLILSYVVLPIAFYAVIRVISERKFGTNVIMFPAVTVLFGLVLLGPTYNRHLVSFKNSVIFVKSNYHFNWYKAPVLEYLGLVGKVSELNRFNIPFLLTVLSYIVIIVIFSIVLMSFIRMTDKKAKLFLISVTAFFLAWSIWMQLFSNSYIFTKYLSYILFLPAILLAIGFNNLIEQAKEKNILSHSLLLLLVFFVFFRVYSLITTLSPNNTKYVLDTSLRDIHSVKIPKNKVLLLATDPNNWWQQNWLAFFLKKNKVAMEYPNTGYFTAKTAASLYAIPAYAFKAKKYDYLLTDMPIATLGNKSIKWQKDRFTLYDLATAREIASKDNLLEKFNDKPLFLPIIPKNLSAKTYYKILSPNNQNQYIEKNANIRMYLSMGLNHSQYQRLKAKGIQYLILDIEMSKLVPSLLPSFPEHILAFLRQSPFLSEVAINRYFAIFKLEEKPSQKNLFHAGPGIPAGLLKGTLKYFYIPDELKANSNFEAAVIIRNTSKDYWVCEQPNYSNPVRISYYWISANQVIDKVGTLISYKGVMPKQTGDFYGYIIAPSKPGKYILRLHLMQQNADWSVDSFVDKEITVK